MASSDDAPRPPSAHYGPQIVVPKAYRTAKILAALKACGCPTCKSMADHMEASSGD